MVYSDNDIMYEIIKNNILVYTSGSAELKVFNQKNTIGRVKRPLTDTSQKRMPANSESFLGN